MTNGSRIFFVKSFCISNKFPEPTKAPFEGVAFSKYHNKDTNRDFTFENSYPNYNEIPPSLESTENNSNSNNSDPDYSMYNGYDAGDICYQCKCIEEEDGDNEEETIGVTYAMGGFTLGYQWSEEDMGLSAGAEKYENDAYGITFAVNDDLSIGYNNYESTQTNTTNVTAEASSIQVAYTMGGASIRLASAEVDNAKYQTANTYDQEAVTLSVSLAF
mgnify:CR=1 FL=1